MSARVLLGAFPDGGYGMRISQPGYDVNSNPIDNERLTFSTDWPQTAPILQSGIVDIRYGAQISFPTRAFRPQFAVLFASDDYSLFTYDPLRICHVATNFILLPSGRGYCAYTIFNVAAV
jgi:hypothetical protein